MFIWSNGDYWNPVDNFGCLLHDKTKMSIEGVAYSD